MRARFHSHMSLLLVLIGLLGLLPAAGCVPGLPQPPAATPPLTPAARPAGEQMGIELNEHAQLKRAGALLKRGAHWVRMPLRWNTIQPKSSESATYKWGRYDSMLEDLSRPGVQVVLTVRDNPEWASSTPCGPLNETGLAGFEAFLRAAVQRYRAEPYNVHHWEIYNEPDNMDSQEFAQLGGCWGNDPEAYADLMKRAYPIIKAEDPKAIVIFGGLALEKFDGSPFNVDFLPQVLKAGAAPYFDWINYHYYPAFGYRWERYGQGVEGKAAYLRGVLRDHGIEKPVACSEIGQPSAGPAAENYSDAGMMNVVFQGFAEAASADLQFAIWFQLQDQESNDYRAYGLVDTQGKPKPAFATYSLLSTKLAQAHYAGRLSRKETGSAELIAYRFAREGSEAGTLLIAWCAEQGASHPLSLSTSVAHVTLPDGATSDLPAGSDGRVSVEVGQTPLLIEY